MRLDTLLIRNMRGIERLELEFDRRLTVLVGRNGAGKSTVLDAVAVLLHAWTHRFGVRTGKFRLDPAWTRYVRRTIGTAATKERVFPMQVRLTAEIDGRRMHWGAALVSAEAAVQEDNTPLVEIQRGVERRLASGEVTLPVVGYYTTARMWLDAAALPGRGVGRAESRTYGYVDVMKASFGQQGFEAWMERFELDRLQRIADADDRGAPLSEVESPMLDAVSNAACACLDGARRLMFRANHGELWVDFEDGSALPFNTLSDGQRNAIGIAADIAWRATQLNPQFGSEAPAKTPGVVLIDEVDLHLHPAWQRRVLDDLTRTFPEVQFIVTTHSPQVMSSAPIDTVKLISLDHEVVDLATRGKTTDAILEDLLGVPARPQAVEDDIRELARLIEDGELEGARRLLEALSAGPPGAEDADVVAARWELEMAERAAAGTGGE